MGGKTSTSTQSVSIPPEVLARYNAVNARAEDVAQRPFQQYGTDANAFVAPLTQSQQAGIANTNASAGAAQPYYQAATGSLGQGVSQAKSLYDAATSDIGQAQQAGQPYLGAATGMTLQGSAATNVDQLGDRDINRYMNPFVQNVVDSTSKMLRQKQQQEMAGQTGNAIRSGAFGGDRAGIAAANLAGQQDLSYAGAISPLYSQAYQQALGTAQQQQGFGLQQQQANLARQQQGAQQMLGIGQQGYAQGMGAAQQRAALANQIYGMGQSASQGYASLGTGAQTAALQGAAAQLQAGQQQQQTEQAGRQALYNQFLQQQGYPFQVAQFLANIAMGTGALSGSTTTTTQPQSFFSDRRLKHDIHRVGETDDGLPIYKFKYKGDNRTQIGLMAQDVEKSKPEAVGLSGGYKTVDYDRATRATGGLVPSSMGGMVYEDRAGEGYADGGMPQLDIFGGGQSRIPASVLAQMQNSSNRKLMLPSMGLKPQSTGFADMMGEAQKAMAAGETLTKGYKTGKAALFGAAPTKDNPTGDTGLFANTGTPEIKGGWLDTIKGWGSSATPAARGGVMGYAGGGMPYGDDDADSTDILGDVVKQGQQQHASLPKPGEAPKAPQSGIGQAVQGIGALTGGIKAAQGLYTGAGKLGSMISGLGSAAEGAGAAAGAAEGLGAAAGAAGTLGSIGSGLAAAGSTAAEILPFLMMLSDERAKHDKKRVGELYDGQPVYSYKYNGDNRTQLGLMAQNVERTHPEAVGSMHGMKMVDYDRATSDAAARGHFYSGGLVPRHGYATDGAVDPDLPAEGAQEAGLVTRFKVPEEYAPIIEQVSRETGIPAAIIAAKIKTESNFNPNATGSAGEEGVNQILRSTAQRPGFGLDPETGNLRDPQVSIPFGARYLKARGEAAGVRDWNDPAEAAKGLAGYNGAGPQARQYAQRVLSLVRDDAGEPSGGGVMPSARRVTPGLAGPGYPEDTPRTSPFKLFAGRALEGRDMKPETKEALTSENLWVPLLSGLGSMLGSPSITLGGAIGHGLMGGTKAYTDLAKSQQEMGASRAQTEATMAQLASSSLEVKDGRLMFRVARPGGGYTLVEYNTVRNMSPADRARYNIDPRLIEEAERFVQGRETGATPDSKEPAVSTPKAPEAPKAPDTRLPHEKEPTGPVVERPTSVGGVALTPEQIKQARAITQERAGFGEKERAAEKDYFTPQYEIARGSENAKQQLVPLAGALAALPREKSIQTSGAAQSVVSPLMAVVNNLGSMLGYKFETNDPSALQQEVDKLATRLNRQQTSDAQQRALGALQELAKGIPTYLNSPGGQAKLVPQLLTENQREIDRQNFFRAWENAAVGDRGQNAQYAKLSSRDANEAFEKEFTESVRAKESAALERMFNDTFSVKDPATGQQKKISAIEYITKYGSTMSPAQKQSFRDRYGKDMKHDVLRYFGVQ